MAPHAQPSQQHGDALLGDEPRGRESIEGLTSGVLSVHDPKVGALESQGPQREGENESSTASPMAADGARPGASGSAPAVYDALNGVVVLVIEKHGDSTELERTQGKEERHASGPAHGAAEPGAETGGAEMLGELKGVSDQLGLSTGAGALVAQIQGVLQRTGGAHSISAKG